MDLRCGDFMNESRKDVFIPLIGQYENIGDIVLRRPLADWLRTVGNLHVFVGRNAPKDYISALKLSDKDIVYTSFSKWYLRALQGVLSRKCVYAFKPGEIQMSLAGMKEHLAMLPVVSIMSLTHQPVLRIGSGSRNFSRLPMMLMKPSVAASGLVYWRDPDTAEYLGCGKVMPDLGFASGDPFISSDASRSAMVVSMRGDVVYPNQKWISAVKSFAQLKNLSIVVVTQVERDSECSQKLARDLDADIVDWNGRDHLAQEAKLRDVYRKTRVVVSDRLHVLIYAFVHGAIPIAVLCNSSKKIARHFSAIDIEGVDISVDSLADAQSVVRAMSQVFDMQIELFSKLESARSRLAELRDQVISFSTKQVV